VHCTTLHYIVIYFAALLQVTNPHVSRARTALRLHARPVDGGCDIEPFVEGWVGRVCESFHWRPARRSHRIRTAPRAGGGMVGRNFPEPRGVMDCFKKLEVKDPAGGLLERRVTAPGSEL
jgi:hypothetical protein